jgi:hypothetical protein
MDESRFGSDSKMCEDCKLKAPHYGVPEVGGHARHRHHAPTSTERAQGCVRA